MTRNIFSMMLGFLIYHPSDAQITFQKSYGVSATCGWYHSMQPVNDGGYIIIGNDSLGVNNTDMLVIKTDESGDTLWTRTYGGQLNEWGSSIQQTTDNGYILTGSSSSFSGGLDAYLIKTDSLGNIFWTKTYGGPGEDWGYSAIQTNDGGYILTGLTFSFGAGSGDVYIVRTDSNGVILWTSVLGGSQWDRGYYIKQTADSSFMIIGETQSYGIGLDNIYLIKVGANGNLVWTKTYGDTFLHDAFFFDSTNDGGFIIAGRGANSGDAAYLLRIDSIGNILWNKTYGKSYIDLAYAAHQTRDNGFILTGRTTNPITFHADILLIKTDSSGTMQWNNVIGGTGYKRGLSVEETNDGGYIIAGENNSEQKIYLIKTDSIGNSECYGGSAVFIEGNPATQVTVASSLVSAASFITLSPATSVSSGSILNTPCSNVSVYDQTENSNFVTVFPDPSTGIFTIKFIIPVNKGTIEIYNMTGNKVFEDIIYLTEKKVVSLNNISKGIYTVKVLTEANVFCKKIIIQ